jgi:hypothetical protein
MQRYDVGDRHPQAGPHRAQRGYLPVSHRLAAYDGEQRVAFGANTFRAFVQMLAASTEQLECSIHGSPG